MAHPTRARRAAAIERGVGVGSLLDEAAAAARETDDRGRSRAAGFSGTWAVTDMAVSVADRRTIASRPRPHSRRRPSAEVVEDLVDDETLEILRATADELMRRSTGLPSPGSLSSFAAPPAGSIRGPVEVGVVVGYAAVVRLVGWARSASASGCSRSPSALLIIAGMTRRRRRLEP